MLQQMRSRHNMKIVMVVVAVAFVVGMVLLSMDPGGGGPIQSSVAATVNGQDVPFELYNSRVTQLAENARARFNKDELSTSEYEEIEEQAWRSILDEILLSQEARRMGLRATDEEIVATLESNPPEYLRQYFVDENGQFDPTAYQQALNDPNYPWRQHEEYLRAILPSYKLRQMVQARATVSEVELRRFFARQTQRHTVEYVGAEWETVELDVPVPEDDGLRAYQQENASRFSTGPRVALDILRIPKAPSAMDRQELLEDAQSMLQELEEGRTRDFATLASIYSEDAASAARGGDLGWVEPDSLAAPLDSLVKTLQPGQRTPPVWTASGVYVVQVDSLGTTPEGRPACRVRQLFLAARPTSETLDSLRTLAFELADDARDDFEAAAARRGLEVEKRVAMTRSGALPGFGVSRRLAAWAFDTAKPGEVGGPFGGDEAIVVVRYVEDLPDTLLPWSKQLAEHLRDAWIEDHKKAKVRRQLETLVEKIRSGATLAEAAREVGLEIQRPAPFTYFQGPPGIGGANAFTAVASELQPGQTSGVVELTRGAYVVHVLERTPFDAEAYAQQRDALYRALVSQRAAILMDGWLETLRAQATIDDRRSPRV